VATNIILMLCLVYQWFFIFRSTNIKRGS